MPEHRDGGEGRWTRRPRRWCAPPESVAFFWRSACVAGTTKGGLGFNRLPRAQPRSSAAERADVKLARTLQSRRVRGALAPKTIAMPYVRFGEPHSSGVRLTSVTTSQLRTFW